MSEHETWNQWSKYVLKELERLNDKAEKLDQRLSSIQTDIAMLKVKAGLWGAMAGMVPAAAAVMYAFIR